MNIERAVFFKGQFRGIYILTPCDIKEGWGRCRKCRGEDREYHWEPEWNPVKLYNSLTFNIEEMKRYINNTKRWDIEKFAPLHNDKFILFEKSQL